MALELHHVLASVGMRRGKNKDESVVQQIPSQFKVFKVIRVFKVFRFINDLRIL